jgi:L-glutamine-phosphate cytidylyltransferase
VTTRGLILAAGRGSRLGPLTADRPKGLVALRGRPLIEWQLHALRGAGIAEIAVVGGYRADALQPFGLPLFRNPRWSETNMVRSLLCADAWLSDAATVISYSDIVYDAATVGRLLSDPSDIAISYDPHWHALWAARFPEPLSDAETFALDHDGFVKDIGRKPSQVSEVEGQYMGLLKFSPPAWAGIRQKLTRLAPDRCDRLDMTAMLRLLMEDGVRVKAVAAAGPWAEIDTADDLSLYESDTNAVKLPEAPPKKY